MKVYAINIGTLPDEETEPEAAVNARAFLSRLKGLIGINLMDMDGDWKTVLVFRELSAAKKAQWTLTEFMEEGRLRIFSGVLLHEGKVLMLKDIVPD